MAIDPVEVATAPVAVRLQLEDEAACAIEPPLEQRIRLRSARIAFPSLASKATVHARLLKPAPLEPYLAQLAIREAAQAEYRREIRADSCDELLDAIAVVVALRLDPPVAPLSGDPVSAEPPQPPSEPSSSLPAAAADPFRNDRVPSKTTVQVSFGVGPALALGPAPVVMPGVVASTALRAKSAVPGVAFNPALGLSGMYYGRAGMTSAWGDATLVLAAARLELCPLSHQDSGFSGFLCGFGDIGQLQAKGRRTHAPAEFSRLWAVLGGSGVLSYSIHPHLSLTATVSVGSPLRRYTLQFEDERLHRTASVVSAVSVGLAFTSQ